MKDLSVSGINLRGKTKDYIIADTLRLIKGSTSRQANKILERKGAFWHHESYDHYVRDRFELERIINYVKHNPSKAGLTVSDLEWKWSTSRNHNELSYQSGHMNVLAKNLY